MLLYELIGSEIMLKTGDIVIEKQNLEKNIKEKMFVVLFNFWHNDKEVVCLSPITNTKKPKYNTKYYLKNYVYIPYEILSNKRLCSVKINATPIYEASEVTPTGLKLRTEVMIRIFNGIMALDLDRPSLDKEHFEYIKNTITCLNDELSEIEIQRKKEKKKLRKIRRRELKQNYNNIKNN